MLLVDRFAKALAYHDSGQDYETYCKQHEYKISHKSFTYYMECKACFDDLHPLFTIEELATMFELTHAKDV